MNNMDELVKIVNKWARDNASNDYFYGSRQSYWAAALANHIITNIQYNRAAAYYGNLWTYRGD